MEKQYYFERNLLSLSIYNPELCKRLSSAQTTLNYYKFIDSKNGERIPAWIDKAGQAHILHSFVDPVREAEKLIAALNTEGYVIILGLGAGCLAEAALRRDDIHKVVVIDYNLNSIAELLCSREYVTLFSDPRFSLLIDTDCNAIKSYIIENYNPCIHNGIRLLPLRVRCDFDQERFFAASDAVKQAIDSVSSDYSVQTSFGRRWFSNIIRNLRAAEEQRIVVPPVKRAAVCAAGPSLDTQFDILKEQRKNLFVIASDTALSSLIAADIKPDAVISIDCQHISYLHFMNNNIDDITLFLDLASPPLLTSRTKKNFFFASGHPFTHYICTRFRGLPVLDTSGANVAFAGVSLAQALGAQTIELYGADFSYPQGMTYTRGAYFYPYLSRRQNRFLPVESQLADFLFKTPSLSKIQTDTGYYYETHSLAMYRRKLELKAQSSSVKIIPARGIGSRLCIERKQNDNTMNPKTFDNTIKLFSGGKALLSADVFLRNYSRMIEALPLPGAYIEQYIQKLSHSEKTIWTTLLPVAAAVKYRENIHLNIELIRIVKEFCITEIEKVLNSGGSQRPPVDNPL
ncbi:MAG: DUF115 domain-containing protein [Spirochaetaceae bacterium]|nr:DUF115 domain-containing protein [Spirochaetaceae bacterium]